MKILILEDEAPAAIRLRNLLNEIQPAVEIIAVIDSVKSAVKWFQENDLPELILADIQLADGISFEIFETCEITCPVIFTTAFDEYALKAFKLNSIDYLLKPINKGDLETALNKYQNLNKGNKNVDLKNLLALIGHKSEQFQKRIIIRFREQLKTVEIDDIAYFYVENKITYAVTKSNLNYQVDFNLDECESILDPGLFFRINRQFIVNINSIVKMTAYSKSRVNIILNPNTTHETIVSTERSAAFKVWLLGK